MNHNFSFLPLLASLLLTASPILAQNDFPYEKNTASYIEYLDKECDLLFQPALNWIDLDLFNVIGSMTKEPEYGAANFSGPVFKSDQDANCLILFSALPTLMHKHSPRGQILMELRTSKRLYFGAFNSKNQDDVPLDFHEYVTVIAGRTAREMFNADTLFIYDLPNSQPYYFVNKQINEIVPHEYTYSTTLWITQNDVFMEIKLLFTEFGWQERERRLREVETAIRFKNRPVKLETVPKRSPGIILTK
ncbi:MAG: hypothetical protein GX993_05810 [Bacteroidales bacterium]|nr:hypothetical protein [Bacteroidales bacterium]